MLRFRNLMILMLLLVLCMGAFATEAHAAPVSIQIKNDSQQTVEIVMDTEREVHRLAPGGSSVFHPNVGDNPTYHVYEITADGKRGRKLWSESFNTIWFGGGFIPRPHVGGDLKWTGGRLKRD